MKRSGKSNEQVQKFPKTASLTADSRAVVVNKTQEQLVDELSLITRQATGTQSHDVADRIIEQVAGAHVWPRPKDASDQVIQAVLTMAEMAPQNATEAMLAVQMIAANDAALLFLRRATADGQTVEGSDGNVPHRKASGYSKIDRSLLTGQAILFQVRDSHSHKPT